MTGLRTYTAEQVAGMLGVSTWAFYESVRRHNCPVPPIRVGRRLVWSKSSVDRLLDPENTEPRGDHLGDTDTKIALTNAAIRPDPGGRRGNRTPAR